MKNENGIKILDNLRKNWRIILSTIAVLVLYSIPSKISVLIGGVILLVVMFVSSFDEINIKPINNIFIKNFILHLTCCFEIVGIIFFYNNWWEYIGNIDLYIWSGVIIVIFGFYALRIFSNWLLDNWCKLLNYKDFDENSIARNFKKNWWFLICSISFFILEISLSSTYLVGSYVAIIFISIFVCQEKSIFSFANRISGGIRFYSALTALGVCYEGAINLIQQFQINIIVLMFFFVLAFLFVYVCLSCFIDSLLNRIKNLHIFNDFRLIEGIIYSTIFIISCVAVTIVFLNTDAFYKFYDLIYTSDSSLLLNQNSYLLLTHVENDIRQPLFALFSAPTVGIPYLIGNLLPISYALKVVLINWGQIFILIFSNFLLSKALNFSGIKRISFMLFLTLTHTYMLFIFMIEQYIIVYFWLMLLIYSICDNKDTKIVFWGSAGTLITNMAMLPFVIRTFGNLKEFCNKILTWCVEFLLIIFAFGKANIIFNLVGRLNFLSKFGGADILFSNKICQYFAFIRNCFFAPNAGINVTSFDYISWQLNSIFTIDRIGILIFILAIISFILNKNKKITLIAGYWIILSIIILVVFGWGTYENGLILYSLYFGWAFIVLLFQLIDVIQNKLKLKFLTPFISSIMCCFLGGINLTAICKLIEFATTYYSV